MIILLMRAPDTTLGLLASKEGLHFSEQLVIPLTEPNNLDRSTLGELPITNRMVTDPMITNIVHAVASGTGSLVDELLAAVYVVGCAG